MVQEESTTSSSSSGLVEVTEASILNTGIINAVQVELKSVGGNNTHWLLTTLRSALQELK